VSVRSSEPSRRGTGVVSIAYETFKEAVATVVVGRNEETPLAGASRRLRDRDSNPNFRSQNPASYH
jgi:hypothetical protein